jgi:hypothetical protein
MANAPTFRSDNIYLWPAQDPTGNSQPAAELVVQTATGLATSRLFVVEHAGGGLKFFRANSADSTVFETDPGNGQVVIENA